MIEESKNGGSRKRQLHSVSRSRSVLIAALSLGVMWAVYRGDRERPCDDPNNAGIETWVEQTGDGSPEIQLEANCQSVTLDG